MSTSINNAFITQYERDVHDVFQRDGSVLKPTVRFKSDVSSSWYHHAYEPDSYCGLDDSR